MTSSCTSSSLSNFRSVVKIPCFISSHSGVQKFICFLCVALEKLPCRGWVEKSYDGMRCHFKHFSLKQIRFYHCETNIAHRLRFKVDGTVASISKKSFPIGPPMMYIYFPDTPRIFDHRIYKMYYNLHLKNQYVCLCGRIVIQNCAQFSFLTSS